MVELREKKLKQILQEINQNTQLKDQYDSKWHSIINFLHNNTGLKIAKVAKAGSKAKQTDYHKGDLDIIFSTSPQIKIIDALIVIEEKAKESFKNVADIKKSKRAVQLNYKNSKLEIDIVYLNLQEFSKEHKETKDFGKLPEYTRSAIKLSKYAFDKVLGDKIKGYEIEIIGANSTCKTLISCINAIANHFTGKIQKYNKKVIDVLKYLT